MNDEIAIKVEGVSKTFKLPHEKNSTIKGLLVNFNKGKKGYETQKALNDISFEVKKGEFFGIVGRNGSGKSTLLKLIAGIYTPDRGEITVNGRLTPFIELGVGFNPELSGRDNVFLNGALLGFNRKEVEAMYDEIVDFAEIERFMDQKLKNYSSGMQVRLAFSIAIRAESDILVLDEVLAVGDEAFQRKCVSVFEKYKARKQTIILVTHDMGVVEKFCNRAIMIEDSRVIESGKPGQVARLYSEHNKESYSTGRKKEDDAKPSSDNIKLRLLDAVTGKPKRRFLYDEEMTVEVTWSRNDVQCVGAAIMKQSGEYVFGPNTRGDKHKLEKGRNQKKICYSVRLNIGEGDYYLKAGLFGKGDKDVLSFVDEGPGFTVEKSPKTEQWGGLTKLQHKWVNEL